MSESSARRIRFLRVLQGMAAGVALLAAGACSDPVVFKHPEDAARQMAPVPACVVRLPLRKTRTGILRSLTEQQDWELVFPTYDKEHQSLPEGAVPCTGRNVFADPAFTGATRITQYPLAIEEGEILLGSGGDHIKVLWMRTHRFADGTEAGPLALVRAKEDAAEVFAIGSYRGLSMRPFFATERIGPEVVITVSDEGCTGNGKAVPCRDQTTVFLPRRGELVNVVSFASDQRDYVNGGEPGAAGRIEYRLTTSARYVPTGVTLYEEMNAKDEAGRQLRHAELERKFTLHDLELIPNEEPLWPQMFPGARTVDGGAPSPRGMAGGSSMDPGPAKFDCCEDSPPTEKKAACCPGFSSASTSQ